MKNPDKCLKKKEPDGKARRIGQRGGDQCLGYRTRLAEERIDRRLEEKGEHLARDEPDIERRRGEREQEVHDHMGRRGGQKADEPHLPSLLPKDRHDDGDFENDGHRICQIEYSDPKG